MMRLRRGQNVCRFSYLLVEIAESICSSSARTVYLLLILPLSVTLETG